MIAVTRKNKEICRIGLKGIFIRRGRYWVNIVTGEEIPVFEGEGGIALKNRREILLPFDNVSATVPPHAPTANAVIARAVAPVNGSVRAIGAVVAVVGTRGNSTDFTQAVRARNAGFAGTGTTIITSDAILRNEALATAALQDPPAGTKRLGIRLPAAALMLGGQIIDAHYQEGGTQGTATECTFNLLGVMYESVSNLDFVLVN